MPNIPKRSIRCPACDKSQPDGSLRNSCMACGCQPVPSYDYPVGSAFHPEHQSPAERQRKEIARQVAMRRKGG